MNINQHKNSLFSFIHSTTIVPVTKYCVYTYILLLMTLLFPKFLLAVQAEWKLISLSDHSFTVNFSTQSDLTDPICSFAFSSTPDVHFTQTLTFDTPSPSTNASAPQIAQSGTYKTHFIQWVVFKMPNSKQSTPQKGTLTVLFDKPILQGQSLTSAKLEHGILIFPLQKKYLPKSSLTLSQQVPFDRGVRIEIIEDGIYKIYGKELQAIGVPISSISTQTYRIFEKDREIPLLISEGSGNTLSANDYIVFYAKRLRGAKSNFEQFSNTGIYRLFWGSAPGTRIAWVSGDRRKDPNDYNTGILIKAQDFSDSLHIEFDNDIRWLGNIADIPPFEITNSPDASDEIDNWYWGTIGDDNLTSFTFILPSPSSDGTARISVRLMGLTSIDSMANDHQLEIYLNNNPVGAQSIARWDGQREYTFKSSTFPASSLLPGLNTISFLTQNTGITDYSALNWISITYPRNHKVLDNNLLFKSSPNATSSVIEYELSGFSSSDIEVWDIDRGRVFTNCIIKDGNGLFRGSHTLLFQDSITYSTTYFAQQIDLRKSPALITLDTLSSGWDTLTSVDYIAIAPDSFYNELSPLLKIHQKRGLKTAFVSIDQIYNRFSWGIKDPQAIRTFLQYCFKQNPDHPPRYLLLAGDTSHDLDKKNRALNIVPTHLSRISGWGPAANDGFFTLVNGDDNFPDLCVGRFPARNRTDLRIIVNKTVKYISTPTRGYWKDNLLMLGGGEKEFTEFNNNMTNDVLRQSINIIRMDADPDSRYYKDASLASSLIADQINAGVFMLNFNGHGGGNIWSDNNFFGYRDLSRLYNGTGGRLPIVISFTCLTGFFESTSYRSLGEEFLRNSENGAICFYGASAYTSRNGNVIMNRLMFENAFNQPFESIGELIDICEMNMLVRYGSQYANLVQQYNLLGDPALPFDITPSTMKLSLAKNALSENDSLKINGSCAPVTSGKVQLLVKAADQEWNRVINSVSGGVFNSTLEVKAGAHTASGIVRAYAWNDTSEVRGWVKFAKDTMMVFDISLSPPIPHYGDSVQVSCRLTADSSADVYCLYAQSLNTLEPSFKGITMLPKGNGIWTSSKKIPIVNSDNTDGKLLIQFRISAQNNSRESEQFSFSIAERPDLTFSNKKLKLYWSSDSLRTDVQVINIGNASISSFDITLLWGDVFSTQNTIKRYHHDQSLAPGTAFTYSFAIPDTQGTIRYSALLSSDSAEITKLNNSIQGFSTLNKGILAVPSDTLFSSKKGIAIYPAASLGIPRTAFLFTDSITESSPLQSSSSWASLTGDSLKMASVGCRPPLTVNDSLVWIFHTQTDQETAKKSGSLSVMTYDSSLSHWVYFSGKVSPASGLVTCTNSTSGPFATAFLDDTRAPDIALSVLGRTLDFVDYAAKDKPFSLFISDPSEIIPSSITILLNNKLFPSDKHSSIPTSGDLKHISITAYPPSSSALDSLTISAMDFAGNTAKRTFTYMPGKDLSIQYISCHPNPFTAAIRPDGSMTKIRFAYSITDVARTINLTIFTVSGRPIRSWDFNNLIGYQEIEWDGRDRDGYRIANGIYYAKLIVKNRSKKVKKVIKIAKLEGY